MRLIVLLFISSSLSLVAGCADDPCEVVCARNAECQPDGPGKDTCVSLCRDLSRDVLFAKAVERQADCYEEKWSCSQLASGVCDASD
jgi:hypothetical protein